MSAQVAKELCEDFCTETKFYELNQAHNLKFLRAFQHNNSAISKMEPDQQKNMREAQKIYFSAWKKVDITSPECAGSHAMGMLGLVSNRIVFVYTVRAFLFSCAMQLTCAVLLCACV